MSYKLTAKTRTEKGAKVRSRAVIPAVVYGAGKDNDSIALAYREFSDLHEQAGESSLIDLFIDDKQAGNVLIQAVQYDPVTDLISHVDLRRIEMGKAIKATIELELIGEAPAVKEAGGTLVQNISALEVECLPKDLVSSIQVDLSTLKTTDDTIQVKDLSVPEAITVLNPHANDVVAKVLAALTQEQLDALEKTDTGDVSDVEVAGDKKEGEEGAEGEAKPEESDKKADDKPENKKEEDKK